ncbi:MAG: hypothetical protein WDA27_07915 [Actinomycetota bacterium]
MPAYRMNIVFTGIDFDDDATFEALADLPNVLWRSQGDHAFATAIVDSASAMKAADEVTGLVMDRVATAQPFKLDEDLVSISDIAARVGVTREAVRNWANGSRHSNFPFPRGTVGDRIKVWAWADVSKWLNRNLALGDPEEFPSPHDVALVNSLFAKEAPSQTRSALMTWHATDVIAARTKQANLWVSPAKPMRSPMMQQHAVKLRVIDGGLSGAA